MMKMRKQQAQLNEYYPKDVYEPLARREMKAILTRFNDAFYEAYPEKLKKKPKGLFDYKPHAHHKQYEVERAIKLYKSRKVRKKELARIKEYLNLQYVVEEQITHYESILQNAKGTKQMISEEEFSSFFPQLHAERIDYLDQIEQQSLREMRKLNEEKRMCEQAIHSLLHSHHSFWTDASRMIGDMVTDSVKHVVEIVDQSLKGGRK